MRNKDSLTHLRLKIMGGYVSLIALFVIASVIVVFKSGGLEENSERYRENIERRSLSEGAFLQLFDLTQLGGQAGHSSVDIPTLSTKSAIISTILGILSACERCATT